MTKDNRNQDGDRHTDKSDRPESPGRRAMLRGTATAMPVVLTLQSGAALARSSNLISASHPQTRDRWGRALCLDTNSVYPVGRSGNLYDLGEPASADVGAIWGREYRVEPKRRSRRIDASEMCLRGKPGYYKTRRNGRWRKVETKGMIVSATALRSFAGRVRITDM